MLKEFLRTFVHTELSKHPRFDTAQVKKDGGVQDPRSLWWKHDLYTNVDRRKNYYVLGLKVFSRSVTESIEDHYGIPADDAVEVLEKLIAQNKIAPLGPSSKVFEPGCNMGRNLMALQKKYGLSVTGADISKKAIELARQNFSSAKSTFYLADLLDPAFFARFPDDYFDLVLTRWHLIHVPQGAKKDVYISNLKRVAQNLVLIEPTREGSHSCEDYIDGIYALSWDDWEAYGPRKTGLTTPDDTDVFALRK